MLGTSELKPRFGPLCAILLVFGCLSLAGCDGEEEAPDAPPSDEQFDDTSGGGSA